MYDINKLTELIYEIVDEIYMRKTETATDLGNAILPVIQKILVELGIPIIDNKKG